MRGFQQTMLKCAALLVAIALGACTKEESKHDDNVWPTDTGPGDSASSTDDGVDTDETESEVIETDDSSLESDNGLPTDAETENTTTDSEPPDTVPADTESTDTVPPIEPIVCTDMDDTWSDIEQEVVDLIIERRTAGFECGGTSFAAATSLVLEPKLTCASRYHCADMTTHDFVDADGFDGSKPDSLLKAAGYDNWASWGILVSAGGDNATAIVNALMTEPSRCQTLFKAVFTDIGVGVRFDKDAEYKWYTTVYFGHLN